MAAVRVAPLPAAEEEQVIRARQLFQVSVAKGEAPLKRLTKKFISLCDEAGSAEDVEKAHEALMREIMLLEMQSVKYNAILTANQREQQSYIAKQQELVDQIKQAEHDISSKKVELEEAKVVRQHKEEYEVLRQVLVQHPTRAATQREIHKVKDSIMKIKAEGGRTGTIMTHRRKQMALLFHVIEDLQRSMEEPLEGTEGATAPGEGQQMEVDT